MPTKPGADGNETASATNDWKKSAAENGSSKPNARNAVQNPSALISHRTIVHIVVQRTSRTLRNTATPRRNASSASTIRRVTGFGKILTAPSMMRTARRGNATSAMTTSMPIAMKTATLRASPAMVISPKGGTFTDSVALSAGKLGSAIEMKSRLMMNIPSNNRSMTSDANDDTTGTRGSMRVSE